jgi:hypothetical protein
MLASAEEAHAVQSEASARPLPLLTFDMMTPMDPVMVPGCARMRLAGAAM